MVLGALRVKRLLEIVAGEQLQHLAEKVGFSYHGRGGCAQFTSNASLNRSDSEPN